MKKLMIIGLLCICISTMVYGGETPESTVSPKSSGTFSTSQPINFNEVSVVPFKYQGQVFMNGAYADFSDEKYKIYSQDQTVYLPLRMVMKLLTSGTEYWTANWNAAKPDSIDIICGYMAPDREGGAVSTGKEKTIHINVGSTKAKADGREITLTKAPKRIEGVVTLPMRSIGELMGKTVCYKNGLIIISSNQIDEKDKSQDDKLAKLKQYLEKKVKPAVEQDNASEIVNVNGKGYYVMLHYDENRDNAYMMLYEQEQGKKPKLLKKSKQEVYGGNTFIDGKYYYVENHDLYALDLKTKKAVKVVQNLDKQLSENVVRLFERGGTLYVIDHQGDYTMCSECLYLVKAGKLEKVEAAHMFGNIIADKDNVYYSVIDGMDRPENLHVYNKKSGQIKVAGSKDKVYGMAVHISDIGETRSANTDGFILEGKLYTLGYKEGTDKQSSLYAINLTNNKEEKIAEGVQKFWLANHQIYYLASDTGFLKNIDLQTNQTKTVIEKDIIWAEITDHMIYYLKNGNGQGQGLYVYDMAAGQEKTITDQPIVNFKSGKFGVIYVAQGITPGVYKWTSKGETALETGNVYESAFGENALWYDLYDQMGSHVIIF